MACGHVNTVKCAECADPNGPSWTPVSNPRDYIGKPPLCPTGDPYCRCQDEAHQRLLAKHRKGE